MLQNTVASSVFHYSSNHKYTLKESKFNLINNLITNISRYSCNVNCAMNSIIFGN